MNIIKKINLNEIKQRAGKVHRSRKPEYILIPNNELVYASEIHLVKETCKNIIDKFKMPVSLNGNISEYEAIALYEACDYKIDTEKRQYIIKNIDIKELRYVLARKIDSKLSRLNELELRKLLEK